MTYADEDVNHWLKLYNEGNTIEEIGLELGITLATVGNRLRKHPDYIPRPNLGGKQSARHNSVEAAKPGSKITKVVLGKASLGHRRRGQGW